MSKATKNKKIMRFGWGMSKILGRDLLWLQKTREWKSYTRVCFTIDLLLAATVLSLHMEKPTKQTVINAGEAEFNPAD